MSSITEAIEIVKEINEEIFDRGIEDEEYELSLWTNCYDFNITMNSIQLYSSVNDSKAHPIKEVVLERIKQVNLSIITICDIIEDIT